MKRRLPLSALGLLLVFSLPPVASAQESGSVDEERAEILGHTVAVTRREAVRLALRNNLDLEVARTDPAVALEQISQAEGTFDPLGFAESSFDRVETPVASSVQSAFAGGAIDQIDEDEWNYLRIRTVGSELVQRAQSNREVGVVEHREHQRLFDFRIPEALRVGDRLQPRAHR